MIRTDLRLRRIPSSRGRKFDLRIENGKKKRKENEFSNNITIPARDFSEIF